jgi:sugar lactone lactonase YvrE
MIQRIVAEPFFRPETEELRYLPECPRMAGGKLIWVSIQYGPDSQEGGLNVLDLGTRTNRHHPLPGRPGFFVETDRPGELVIGLERRLVRYDLAATRIVETLAHLPDDPRVIINDGIAIPGGILFGTKDLEFRRPIAALFRFDDATRELRELLGGQFCSNGKFLRDGILVDIDSAPRTITEYRYDGALDLLRLIVPPDVLPAIPDGLRLTPGGESIVVAFVNLDPASDGLAQEIRLSDGAVLTEWIFPGSPRVTCPEFAMVDGEPRLLFTTAAEGIREADRESAPEAGTIFICRTELSPTPPPAS